MDCFNGDNQLTVHVWQRPIISTNSTKIEGIYHTQPLTCFRLKSPVRRNSRCLNCRCTSLTFWHFVLTVTCEWKDSMESAWDWRRGLTGVFPLGNGEMLPVWKKPQKETLGNRIVRNCRPHESRNGLSAFFPCIFLRAFHKELDGLSNKEQDTEVTNKDLPSLPWKPYPKLAQELPCVLKLYL